MNAVVAREADLEAGITVEQEDVGEARTQMLVNLFASFEALGIRYVVLAGYENYPKRIDSDVDLMVSENDFERLPRLFRDGDCVPGANLIQVFRHETTACYYVFARQVGSRMAYLHVDAAASYRRRGRMWLESERVLASRRRTPAGFWIPAPAVEFEYYFVKRIDKGIVERVHLERLAARLDEAQQACREVLDRLFSDALTTELATAIARIDVDWFGRERMALRSALARSLHRERLGARVRARLADARRLWFRIAVPTGFVIAVLGPDGSGKTSAIEHLEREFAPAFRRVRRFHLRPRFGCAPGRESCTEPHAQGPRSSVASLVKVGYFLADYWLGWARLVAPMRRRSTLVVFDRYYHDMLVDEARYRLPNGFAAARRLAPLIPKPDMWLVLHAPAAELLKRKREVSEAAATALVDAYRALATRLPQSALLETTGSLDATLQQAVDAVRCALVERERRRSSARLHG